MNKETINDLLTLTEKQSSKQNLTINKNKFIYNVSINADKGKVHIDIEKKKLSNKEVFEKWLTENVDDDIFTEAYAKLSEYSGLSLHDLDKVYKNHTDEFIKDFKEIIKQVATDKINDILLKYELK